MITVSMTHSQVMAALQLWADKTFRQPARVNAVRLAQRSPSGVPTLDVDFAEATKVSDVATPEGGA